MKRLSLQLAILLCATTIFAQWVPVNTGLDNFPPTSLWPFGEDMALGTQGGGIYKTTDNGDNWVTINGNLGNLNVNSIRGFSSLTSMFVATEGGPYVTMDMSNYTNCSSTGLTNTDINYFGFGNENMGGDFMVGTNGGGVFGSGEYTGPWTPANLGVTGDGFIVNDMGGYSEGGQEYAIMATDGGTYWAINGATEWTAINNGLSGDALKVKKIAGLAFMVLIATHDGLYYNYDLADEWMALIPNEKLNTVLVVMSPSFPTGFACLAFGENGFYSEDFFSWIPLDLGGLPGEVTTAHVNSTHIFLGFTSAEKDSKETGAIYRKPLDQLLVGIDQNKALSVVAKLNQNFPNPFTGFTKISYSLANSGMVSLKVYDVLGNEIQTLVNEYQHSGSYSINFDAANLPAKTYIYTLQINDQIVETKKMILLY